MAESIRVVLADDEPSILEIFSSFLRFSGFTVTTAENGLEALERTIAEQPQVVVLDIRMPKMDGWEACRLIKTDPRTQAIPVIFLTAFDQVQEHERARQLGVQGYVTKPCEPSQLIDAIHQALQVTNSPAK